MKRGKKYIGLTCSLLCALIMNISVYAEEQKSFVILKMVTAIEDIEAKTEPKDDADIFHTFEEGHDLLVIDDSDSIWYAIVYQGNTAYVKQESVVDNVIYGEQPKEIDEELSEVGEETTILVEAIDAEETEMKRNIIWGSIIGVLVIAVIVVGVAAKVRETSGEEEEEE